MLPYEKNVLIMIHFIAQSYEQIKSLCLLRLLENRLGNLNLNENVSNFYLSFLNCI
jgi:hypothetical protein